MSDKAGCSRDNSYYGGYDYFKEYDDRNSDRRSGIDQMQVSDTEDNPNHSHRSTISYPSNRSNTDDDRGSVDQVCRCCGAELRGANSLNSLQNSVMYDYFPSTNSKPTTSSKKQHSLDIIGPDELPVYGSFFQKKLEDQLSQVSTHIRIEKTRKEEFEKRLEVALKENEELRDHLSQLQSRIISFQHSYRKVVGPVVGTSV